MCPSLKIAAMIGCALAVGGVGALIFMVWCILTAPRAEVTPIQEHPRFAELRVRYEWDERTQAFPLKLKSGALNPLCGVTEFLRVIPPPLN